MSRLNGLALALVMAIGQAGFGPSAFGQEPDIVFEVVPIEVTPDSVSVSIQFSYPASVINVGAWSYSVCHDPAKLDVTSWEWGTDAATAEDDGGPPWVESTNVLPDGISQWVILGGHLGGVYLPAGTGLEILRIHYSRFQPDSEFQVDFCAIGVPPVDPFLVSLGQSRFPTTISLVIDGASAFVRGDCNGDGGQNLADSIFLEQYLFLGGDSPLCLSACDMNDDGQVNIADSVTNLSYLFILGSPPPAPFGSCGPDPTPDDLACNLFACP